MTTPPIQGVSRYRHIHARRSRCTAARPTPRTLQGMTERPACRSASGHGMTGSRPRRSVSRVASHQAGSAWTGRQIPVARTGAPAAGHAAVSGIRADLRLRRGRRTHRHHQSGSFEAGYGHALPARHARRDLRRACSGGAGHAGPRPAVADVGHQHRGARHRRVGDRPGAASARPGR
nr:putative toluene monooxygenase subunit D [uncultured bacterium]